MQREKGSPSSPPTLEEMMERQRRIFTSLNPDVADYNSHMAVLEQITTSAVARALDLPAPLFNQTRAASTCTDPANA